MHSLLGQECALCGARRATHHLCSACRAGLPYLPAKRCPVCALPSLDGDVCGACLAHPPAFTRTRCALTYAFPMDAMIQSLKYGANLALATTLGELLLPEVNGQPRPDAIIPMPLHPERLRERGFNQALEIAKYLSRSTGIPLLANACIRTRNTTPQTSLPWKERANNIRGAFECRIGLEGKHVVVLDDVMTTGATVHELAKVLHKRGASEVSAWVIARTLRQD